MNHLIFGHCHNPGALTLLNVRLELWAPSLGKPQDPGFVGILPPILNGGAGDT